MNDRSAGWLRLLAALAGVVAVTWIFFAGLHATDATTAALAYLLVVLLVAASSPLWVAISTTVAAALALDFFFFPPVGRFNIDDPNDWAAFFTFVAVSVVASRLSSRARAREREAIGRRDDLGRLFEFSRDVLRAPDGGDAIPTLARNVADRFQLDYVGLNVPGLGSRDRHEIGRPDPHYPPQVAPLRGNERMLGALTVAGRGVEPPTLDALASVVAIAIERLQLLEARRSAERSQHSAEMKSVLLASIAHDVRTPLTAIQLALRNLDSTSLTDDQRVSQVSVATTAAERLMRLFQSILEMTRIDAGDTAPSPEWVHPEEIIDAAIHQVETALAAHKIAVVDRSNGQSVHVDTRLTSAALAHVLENAAHYSPAVSTITVIHEVTSAGLLFSVQDEGAGITQAELPYLFDRFYRGGQAGRHVSGAGMGLAITRGLLAAEGGRVWADERADHGARFHMLVPAEHRALLATDVPDP